jgi:hydrogenase maturation protease
MRRMPLIRTAVNESNTPTELPGPTRQLLLLGLGNDILTDDAVGLNVVRELQPKLAAHPSIDIRETTEMGLALLDFITGYRAVVIVDSIQTGKAPPGFLHELDASALNRLTGRTPHFVGVSETLALGRQLGLAMPEQVRIFAIEVEDPFTLGTDMSPALQSALPGIVERIAAAVRRLA